MNTLTTPAVPVKIEAMEELARTMVGDGKKPNLYFVTRGGTVVNVSRYKRQSYNMWRNLAEQFPNEESALEDRQTGVIASREPEEEGSTRLVTADDYR